MTASFEHGLALLTSESKRFNRYIQSLFDSDLIKPSPCEGWTARDFVAHLVGVADFYSWTVTRGLAGDATAPDGRSPAGSGTGASEADRIARGAAANRELLSHGLAAVF